MYQVERLNVPFDLFEGIGKSKPVNSILNFAIFYQMYERNVIIWH